MNDRIDWREIAASDDILNSAESLLERALGICENGPFEDRYDACQFLMQYGTLSVEEKKWRGALWLKRLNELRLSQFGSDGIDEIAAFLNPKLHGVLAERLEENGRTLEDWRDDPMAITREVFADRNSECAIPGLLMATQIRLMFLKNSGDDGLVARTTALEADMYADAGFVRDAKDSAELAVEILRQGTLNRESVSLINNSLLDTSDKCEAHGELEVAMRLREAVRSVCDDRDGEYVRSTVSLADAYWKSGDLREAYRLAQDADRPEVVKDEARRQLVAFFVSLLRVELTGDMRLISTDVDNVTDEFGGSADAMRLLRAHFMKIMKGETLSDAELLEGAHQFVECARHGELMNASERTVVCFVAALKQLLSMGDFASQASWAKQLVFSAKSNCESVSDDLRIELESLERMVHARCDEPKAPGAMQAPKAAFSLDSITAKLSGRLSGGEPE